MQNFHKKVLYSNKSPITTGQPLSLSFLFGGQKPLTIKFEPRKIFTIATFLVISLVTLSSLGQIYRYTLAGGNNSKLVDLFYLNAEKNIPTFYSSVAIFCCSLLLAVIARNKYTQRDRYRLHWTGLSLIFLYLSLDEALALHERSIVVTRDLLNTDGFFYYAWIIPAICLLSIFIMIYLRFILSLPQKTRFLFILAGTRLVK